jgi:O-antigen ligase
VRQAFYYAVVGVIAISIVASLSRTGLVMLALVIAATLLLPYRLFFRTAAQKLGYALSLAGAAVVAGIAGSTPFLHRAGTIFNFSNPSGDRGSGRLDLWRAALHGFRDHPWFGLGAGNFQAKALDLLQTTPGVNTAASYVAPGRVVHNAYIEALTELGVVGLALFLLILALTVRSYLTTFRRAHACGDRAIESFSIALLVAVFGFCVSMFFNSNELGKPLWIFIGLAIALERIPLRSAAPAPAAAEPSPLAPAVPRPAE